MSGLARCMLSGRFGPTVSLALVLIVVPGMAAHAADREERLKERLVACPQGQAGQITQMWLPEEMTERGRVGGYWVDLQVRCMDATKARNLQHGYKKDARAQERTVTRGKPLEAPPKDLGHNTEGGQP